MEFKKPATPATPTLKYLSSIPQATLVPTVVRKCVLTPEDVAFEKYVARNVIDSKYCLSFAGQLPVKFAAPRKSNLQPVSLDLDLESLGPAMAVLDFAESSPVTPASTVITDSTKQATITGTFATTMPEEEEEGINNKAAAAGGRQDNGPEPSNANTSSETETEADNNHKNIPGPSRPIPGEPGKRYGWDPLLSQTAPMLYPQPFDDEVNKLYGMYLKKRTELDAKGVPYGADEDLALRRVAERWTTGCFSKVLEFRADMY